jgi:hypothetical protein
MLKKRRFSYAERYAVWNCNGQRCWWCGERHGSLAPCRFPSTDMVPVNGSPICHSLRSLSGAKAASREGVDARCLSGSTSSSAGSVHFRRASTGDRGHIPVSHHSCNNHAFPQNAACARDRRPGFRRVSCPAAP